MELSTVTGNTMGYHFTADVGGTFTDIILVSSTGGLWIKKILSTPPDYERAVINGLESLLKEHRIRPSTVERVSHATTVATNAVLERKGAKTGLVTTRGFRDVLELRRMRFPDTYNLFWEKPAPLVDRYLRLEVQERMSADGEIIEPLDLEGTQAVVRHLVEEEGIESLAVCLLNSYVNPVHERIIGDIVKKQYPHLPLTLSSEVLPEIKEYERTSTTVINAYVMPVVANYLSTLHKELTARGITPTPLIMQSSGGLMPVPIAVCHPMHILESGPAAGVVGARHLAQSLGYRNAISFDMGGTTAKAAMIEDGEPRRSNEYEVGAPISMASRILKGGGYILRVPAIDVAEVGAGGGSIVYVDAVGQLHVGPRSAGAVPGPVCYDRGGDEPTVTDANLILGYFNPRTLLGGDLAVNLDNAQHALAKVANAINLPLMDTAFGVYQVVNAAMARAIRAVSVECGRDVRDSLMVVFGGCGPAHAVEIARSLGIGRVLVPRAPGVFSALGLAYADVERHLVRTYRMGLRTGCAAELEQAFSALGHDARSELVTAGWPPSEVAILRYADLLYRGQSSALRIPIDPDISSSESISRIEDTFQEEYRRTYGHAQEGERVEVVNIRVIARITGDTPVLPPLGNSHPAPLSASRPAYFGPTHGFVDTPILTRSELVDCQLHGPIIVEEYDTTVVVPPSCTVSVDRSGNMFIAVGDAL